MREKNELEVGFTLIEMIVCFSVITVLLLLPRLNFIGIENKQSKGLNNWEWDVFVGQVQLEFREVSFVEKIVPENRESMLRFRLRTGDEVTYEKLNNHLIRKVNMRGREVILQNVEMVSYEVTPHLLFINVKDRSGKIYEGVAIRYSEMGIHV